MICTFDIETVPDVELLRQVYNYEGSDIEVCEKAYSEQLGSTGNEFLPMCFHKIVSLASVIADDHGRFVKIGNFARDLSDISLREEEILRVFSSYLNKNNPRLVSFNGRFFDMPVICVRSLRYNINLSSYYETENQILGKSKWENYRQRNSEKFHLDLLDSLGGFGSYGRKITLDHICKMSGIVGKYDVSGSMVYELVYKDNNIKSVDSYCQSDVLNTFWLFLKFELSRGNLTIRDYYFNLEILSEKLSDELPYSSMFKDAIRLELDKIQIDI